MVQDTAKRHYEQETFWHFKCECPICLDKDLDKRKHSLRCSLCGNIRPIDLKTWKMYELDSQWKDGKSSCSCMVPDDNHATEQDVRMYKYIWNKVTTIQASGKV